jgi:hypothetical protein
MTQCHKPSYMSVSTHGSISLSAPAVLPRVGFAASEPIFINKTKLFQPT